jgi:hypothetical protein
MKRAVCALSAVLCGIALAAPGDGAAEACEKAVRETLAGSRGPAPEVSFNAPPAAAPGPADAAESVLRGSGRVRNGRTFSYSCNFDTRKGEVSGVVLRDASPASAQRAAAPVANVEPDLSRLSPAACESAAASALQRRWPNVSRIAFNSDTRSLSQDAAGEAQLSGRGTALPTADAPSTHFSYRCTIDARSGRVTAARVAD